LSTYKQFIFNRLPTYQQKKPRGGDFLKKNFYNCEKRRILKRPFKMLKSEMKIEN